jgi:hypothetical protein
VVKRIIMEKYKTTNIRTGEVNKFRSRSEINKKYPLITISNLDYHFSRCKKSDEIIKGVLIEVIKKECKHAKQEQDQDGRFHCIDCGYSFD